MKALLETSSTSSALFQARQEHKKSYEYKMLPNTGKKWFPIRRLWNGVISAKINGTRDTTDLESEIMNPSLTRLCNVHPTAEA